MAGEQAIVTADVDVSERGDTNTRRIIGSDLQCSWELNAAGALSCRATVEAVNDAGLPTDLRGYWLDYTHPTAGAWSGEITASVPQDGILEITAEGYEVLTRKRLVTLVGTDGSPVTGTPGGLFRQAFEQMTNAGTTYLTLGTIDGSGANIEAAFEREDFFDSVAPALTTDAGYEWEVTNDRKINFSKRLGSDKSSSVLLVEGKHIRSGRWSFDKKPIVNRIHATGIGTSRQKVGKKKKKKKWVDFDFQISPPILVEDKTSIDDFGVLEEFIDYGYVGTEQACKDRAIADLARLGNTSAEAVELTVADVDGAFASCIEGDTISVELGISGVRGTMRIYVRALDVQAGVLILSGLGSAD